MKKNSFWQFATILCLFGMMTFTACTESDNPIDSVTPTVQTPIEAVAHQLGKINGVRNVEVLKKKDGRQVIRFNYDQLIDHKNPAKGTFKQRCSIVWTGDNNVNVLQTEGYKTADKVDNLDICDLTEELGGNQIDVEYRYFGESLPEPFENLDYTYLYSEQASEDLHAVVKMLRESGLLKGKWVSTGLSKNGITAALYAYNNSLKGYNDIDVYVPFGAPFFRGIYDTRGGDYLYNTCGKETGTNAKVNALFQAIIQEPLLTQLSPYAAVGNEKYIEEGRQMGFEESEISKEVWKTYIEEFWNKMSSKYAYIPASILSLYIPDPKTSTLEAIDWFVRANSDSIRADYASRQNTRALTDAELLKERKENFFFTYYVQAMRELGFWTMKFPMLEGCGWLTPKEMEEFYVSRNIAKTTAERYAPQYDPTLMNSFLDDFLPKTTMKMIFVYGADDYWTGGAIPDPTNPNVEKIVVPGGVHSSEIRNTIYYPKEYRTLIVNKVKAALGM